MFVPSSVPGETKEQHTETVVKNMVLFNCMRRSCVVLDKTATEDHPEVDLCGWSQGDHAAYCDHCLVLCYFIIIVIVSSFCP